VPPKKLLSSGPASLRAGITQNQLNELCRRKLVTPAVVAGRVRLYSEDQIPAIRKAALAAGLVHEDAVAKV
jgi:DNA-binding transcriptional MerR regulator